MLLDVGGVGVAESNWDTDLPAWCVLGVGLSEHTQNVAGDVAGVCGRVTGVLTYRWVCVGE